MDILWIVVGGLCLLLGLAGSVLPILPGPPLAYVGLLLQQFRSDAPFTSKFLWVWAAVTLAVVVLEYVIPVYGTKRYGGSKYGVWGCTIGLVAGFWLGPIGIILGPFIGALIGEMIYANDSHTALRAAFGSFIGFLAGTVLKLIACGVMIYYYIAGI